MLSLCGSRCWKKMATANEITGDDGGRLMCFNPRRAFSRGKKILVCRVSLLCLQRYYYYYCCCAGRAKLLCLRCGRSLPSSYSSSYARDSSTALFCVFRLFTVVGGCPPATKKKKTTDFLTRRAVALPFALLTVPPPSYPVCSAIGRLRPSLRRCCPTLTDGDSMTCPGATTRRRGPTTSRWTWKGLVAWGELCSISLSGWATRKKVKTVSEDARV